MYIGIAHAQAHGSLMVALPNPPIIRTEGFSTPSGLSTASAITAPTKEVVRSVEKRSHPQTSKGTGKKRVITQCYSICAGGKSLPKSVI
jgi:hypothetical protein